MTDTLITFETAKLAKEKGFNEKTKKSYSTDKAVYERHNRALDLTKPIFDTDYLNEYWKAQDIFKAPTQSLLQKWLRENKQISVCVDFRDTNTPKVEGINSVFYDVMIYRLSGGDAWKKIRIKEIDDNYEKALEKGLQEALKLI